MLPALPAQGHERPALRVVLAPQGRELLRAPGLQPPAQPLLALPLADQPCCPLLLLAPAAHALQGRALAHA